MKKTYSIRAVLALLIILCFVFWGAQRKTTISMTGEWTDKMGESFTIRKGRFSDGDTLHVSLYSYENGEWIEEQFTDVPLKYGTAEMNWRREGNKVYAECSYDGLGFGFNHEIASEKLQLNQYRECGEKKTELFSARDYAVICEFDGQGIMHKEGLGFRGFEGIETGWALVFRICSQ